MRVLRSVWDWPFLAAFTASAALLAITTPVASAATFPSIAPGAPLDRLGFSVLPMTTPPQTATPQTFSYTGSVQTYTVPAGDNALQVTAIGGSGGAYYSGGSGGQGGEVSSTVPVSGGETLYVYVGGNGAGEWADNGGFNGGGGTDSSFAGTGGGASDIRASENDLSSRILIAGGGGGAGTAAGGGSAGFPTGSEGGQSSDLIGGPGAGGSQGSGGAGGWTIENSGYPSGASGQLGSGGHGGEDGGVTAGGGGGGYYGGGGGGSESGGGGGSDYVEPGAADTAYSTSGAQPEVSITPTSSNTVVAPVAYDFGSVVAGQSSTAEQFTVTNNGAGPSNVAGVSLSGADAGSFTLSADTCTGQSLPADGICTVDVSFAPTPASSTDDAEQYAELDVNADAGDYGAELTGTGLTQPTFGAFPFDQVDFGQVEEGASRQEAVTIMNTGSVGFTPAPATITNDSHTEFSVTNDQCAYRYLPSRDRCEIYVKFAPSTADATETATLNVVNSDSTVGGSTTVPMTGEGQSPPTIGVASSPTDFGQVNEGSSSQQTVTVTNTGDTSLTVNASSLSGAEDSEFSIANDDCQNQTLAMNASCTIELGFAPTAGGEQTAQLMIPNDDPTQNGQTAVTVEGDSIPGTLSVTPNTGAYGSVAVGQSQTQTFTVSDTGVGTVNIGQDAIEGADPGQFTITADLCANATLTPNGQTNSCTVDVRYTATERGAQAAELTLGSDAQNATAGSSVVPLSGTGLAPANTSVAPASQEFGSVTEGQSSQTATITVTDGGDEPLNLAQASIVGQNVSAFAIVSGQDTCSNASVPGGGTCTIVVQFTPNGRGAQAATLQVPSVAAPGSPATVSLNGTGLAPGDSTVSPSFGDFGAVTNGQTSSPMTFTITNIGDNALNVGRAIFSGPNAADFSIVSGQDNCANASLLGAGACRIAVQFTPTARGERIATLSIPSNAATGPPATVQLEGDGLAPGKALVDPSAESFGTVTVGKPAARKISLVNIGDEPLSLGPVAIIGAQAFSVASGQDTCSEQSLAAGADCSIVVQFSPASSGERSATLSIPTGTTGAHTRVTLNGIGQTAPAALTRSSVKLNSHTLTLCAGCAFPHVTLRFTLTTPSSVHLQMQRQARGRWVAAGSETLALRAGLHRETLGKEFADHQLTAGRYRLLISATARHYRTVTMMESLIVTTQADL